MGHEVRLLRAFEQAQAEVSPVAGAPFMVRAGEGGFEFLFPGNRKLTEEIGPRVHPEMQVDGLSAELTGNEKEADRRRLQWYAGAPHRFERAELLVTLRGPQEILDRVKVRGGGSRYRGVAGRFDLVMQQVHRKEGRGHGTSRFLPPVGPKERDDYVFRVHDGGWASLTVDVTGEGAGALKVEAWLTGYEAPARQTVVREKGPMEGPLLLAHPYGFSRWLKLL